MITLPEVRLKLRGDESTGNMVQDVLCRILLKTTFVEFSFSLTSCFII
jgi:hypothetical protein